MKFIYKLSAEWVHAVINLILAWALANYYNSENMTKFWIILVFIIITEIWFWFVGAYKKYKYRVQKNTDLILSEIVTSMSALDDYMNGDNISGKGIFEYASNLATVSMYKVLEDITGCEVRVSVIQQFHEYNSKRKCMMISRRSKKRTNCSKEKLDVEYSGKTNYYFLKILKDNEETYIFFDTKEEIEKKFFWKRKQRKSKIFKYIGLAEKVATNDVAFLLQIDAMEKNAFGKNKDELSVFADNYIYPYVQFLRHAYNIQRNIRKGDENE